MKGNKKTSSHLSKTLFMKGVQCHKALYLEKNLPELKAQKGEDTLRRLEWGHEVGSYAKQLFPQGVEVPYEGLTHTDQLKMTQSEIAKGTKTIYEAAFSYDGIFVKLDILKKSSAGWQMYEVKAANEFKEHYLNDLSIQYFVATKSGLPVKKVYIVYLNNKYVRKGNIDPQQLFIIEDKTNEVLKNQKFIQEKAGILKKMLGGKMPEVDLGGHCFDPYYCDFWDHCTEHLPENSVIDLCGSTKIKFELYKEGYYKMADLPLNRLEQRQRFQVEAFIGKKEIVDSAEVKVFLDSLSYPLYFLDFETIQPPIPAFDGTRPNQKIPFQYSLYVINSKGGQARHIEYLAEPGADPREEIAKRLINEISDNACVLVYHKSFEIEILKTLKEWFPKYAGKLDNIIARIKDLKDPFAKRHVYHWKMNGYASLKIVLPVLVPDMAYEGMDISDGGMASEAYLKMCESNDPSEINKIRQSLLEYCKRDTLGMVMIMERLKKYCKKSG